VLGKLARKNEADCSLDLSGGDSWLLVVTSQRGGLHSNLFKDVSDERIQNGHGFGGNACVGMHLLKHLCNTGNGSVRTRQQKCFSQNQHKAHLASLV